MYAILFLDNNVDEKANNFQVAKVQPQGDTKLFLDFFCQFQPGVVYIKSVRSIFENLENTPNHY